MSMGSVEHLKIKSNKYIKKTELKYIQFITLLVPICSRHFHLPSHFECKNQIDPSGSRGR